MKKTMKKTMEITIDVAISNIEMIQTQLETTQQPRSITLDIAIATMRKYEKIEQILDDCNLEAWEIEKKIREVIDNGNE